MSQPGTVAPRLRAILWLHRREQAGLTGRLALPMALVRLALLVFVGVRLWTLAGSWADLPDFELRFRLWLLMAASWSSLVLMAVLGTLQTAMDRREVGIMHPLPLDYEVRWRLVLARVASTFGIVTIGSTMVTAGVLTRFGVDWMISYLAWIPAATCIGILLPLFILWLLNGGQPRPWAVGITVALLGSLGLIIMMIVSRQSSATPFPPIAMIPDALIVTAITVGFGARWLGRWYVTLAQDLVNGTRRARDFLGPVSHVLRSLLARYRTAWAAIALKELRQQARDVFILLRVAVMLGGLPLFVVSREHLPNWGGSSDAVPVAYALMLAVYAAIETTPSPFGGEGNRLTLAVLNEISPRDMIIGKALAVIAPLVVQMWVVAVTAGVWNGSNPLPLAGAILNATVAVIFIGTILTCLSARDIDLQQPVESGAQALLVEHVPASMRRVTIIGITLAMAIALSMVIISQRWFVGLPVVTVGGLILTTLAYRDAHRRLNRMGAA